MTDYFLFISLDENRSLGGYNFWYREAAIF